MDGGEERLPSLGGAEERRSRRRSGGGGEAEEERRSGGGECEPDGVGDVAEATDLASERATGSKPSRRVPFSHGAVVLALRALEGMLKGGSRRRRWLLRLVTVADVCGAGGSPSLRAFQLLAGTMRPAWLG